jgi:hypothetical protein
MASMCALATLCKKLKHSDQSPKNVDNGMLSVATLFGVEAFGEASPSAMSKAVLGSGSGTARGERERE